jgi:hypothetical protein
MTPDEINQLASKIYAKIISTENLANTTALMCSENKEQFAILINAFVEEISMRDAKIKELLEENTKLKEKDTTEQ